MRVTKKQYIKSEAETRSERSQIAGDILRAKLAYEEERHSCYAGQNSEEVCATKLLFVEQRFKNEHVDGRCVLKKDCVRGCRQFRCDDE